MAVSPDDRAIVRVRLDEIVSLVSSHMLEAACEAIDDLEDEQLRPLRWAPGVASQEFSQSTAVSSALITAKVALRNGDRNGALIELGRAVAAWTRNV